MVSDNDPCLIVNIGALKNGLLALLKEDASDLVRAEQYWGKVRQLLETEEANDVGASAEGTVNVDDDFAMSEFALEMDAGAPGLLGWPG